MGALGLLAGYCAESAPVRVVVAAGLVALSSFACSSGGGRERGSNATGGATGSLTGGATATGGSGHTGGDGNASGGTSGGAAPAAGHTSSGGASNSGGNSSTGGATSSGGTAPGTGGATGGVGGSNAMACQMASYSFVPKIPTVYVMVDRSGSMFDCISTATTREPSCPMKEDTSWTKLKVATLTVIESLQAQVRFGFASFTGTDPTRGGTCPMIDQVDPALNNAAPIKTLYDSLAFQPETTESGKKFETPARQSL
ncbi:MAG TPA: hypothetical protein VEX18_11900, partial [Polyangiaceae bacterium]|nr:hypothetical protein [Polyangiaceae bacterium]